MTRPNPHTGELYSNTMKTIALGLIYGPLYPVTFLWTSIAMVVCYSATKYNISHYSMRPPKIDEEMMDHMRSGISAVLFAAIGMQAGLPPFFDTTPPSLTGLQR